MIEKESIKKEDLLKEIENMVKKTEQEDLGVVKEVGEKVYSSEPEDSDKGIQTLQLMKTKEILKTKERLLMKGKE